MSNEDCTEHGSILDIALTTVQCGLAPRTHTLPVTCPSVAFAANRPSCPFRLQTRQGFRPNQPVSRTRRHEKRRPRHFCCKCGRQENESQGYDSHLRTNYPFLFAIRNLSSRTRTKPSVIVRNAKPRYCCGSVSSHICLRRKNKVPRP